MNGLRDEFGDQVDFLYLNANREGEAAFNLLGLNGHPGIVIFDSSGSEVLRTFGSAIEEDTLYRELTSVMDEVE